MASIRSCLAIGTIALAACAGPAPEGATSADALSAEATETTTKTVCFVTHNLGTAINVTGTMFTNGPLASDMPVLLTLHGDAARRSYFDGGPAGPSVAGSFARELAARGYAVVAIDRPGYGDSHYDPLLGGGHELELFEQINMTHEIVQSLEHGTYQMTDGACPSGAPPPVASSRVVLVGHSLGGGIAMGYATEYHDIAGMVSMGFSNQGNGRNARNAVLFTSGVAALTSPSGYVPLWTPGPNGVSTDCLAAIFYPPGARREVYEAICANANIYLSPIGDMATVPLLQSWNLAYIAAHKVGPTPALLAFFDKDAEYPGPGNPFGDVDLQTPEAAYWTERCGCDVSTFTQKNAGHDGMFHDSLPTLVSAIDHWLVSRQLGGRGSLP